MSLRERTLPLRRGLARLRRRVRNLLVILGLSRLSAFLVGGLVLFFAADYVLRLPLWVRGCLLAAFAAALLVVLFRHLVRPMAKRLDDEWLAGKVEAVHPELQDRLRSGLAFGRAEEDPDNEDSPAMMAEVVDQAIELTRGVRFDEVARSGRALRWSAVAVALLGVAIAAAVTRADLVSVFVKRSLLLRDLSWPRRTTLDVVGMRPGEARRVTRGRETTLRIRARGSLPDRVVFTYWEAQAGRGKAERVELAPAPEDRSLFAITLPVYTSYVFTVAGGDDDREIRYRIQALTPPSILEMELDCTYPAYLGKEPETLRGGDQRLPEGTRVVLRMRANMALERALIGIGAEEAVPLERVDADRFRTELLAERDLRYSIRLVGASGEENDPGVDTFMLRVARDQAPIVRVETPGATTERLASGVVLVGFRVRDDHRVASARLGYRLNDGEERVVELGGEQPEAVTLRAADGLTEDRMLGLAVIDLARLRRPDGAPTGKGDRIFFRVTAVDSAGQEQSSRAEHRVEIVSDDDLSQSIQGRQQELREAVRRGEERARDGAGFLATVQEVRADQTEFRRGVGRSLAQLARILDDLDSISGRLQGVVNLYVFNRLGDRSAADQMLPYFERHRLEIEDKGSHPFTGDLYRTLWVAHRESVIRIGSAQAKPVEMADLADRLTTEQAPKAYRALSAVLKARSADEGDALLREAGEYVARVVDGYGRLSELMREWENFESLLRWFKGLRDTQKSVIEDLERLAERGG